MERKATVDSISKKLSSSRAATQALSKALTEAEIDRKRASDVSDCMHLMRWVLVVSQLTTATHVISFVGKQCDQETVGRIQVKMPSIGA